MKVVHWAFAAATVGSFLAFAPSLYVYGVAAPFPTYPARSLAVVWLTFILMFTVAYNLTVHSILA